MFGLAAACLPARWVSIALWIARVASFALWIGSGALGGGCGLQDRDIARPRRAQVLPPKGTAGRGAAGTEEAGSAGTVSAGEGGSVPTGGNAGSDNGGTSVGEPSGSGGQPSMPSFDAGTEPDRNAVMAGELCDRLSTIQCAGEAACCTNPGRDFNACKDALMGPCTATALFDQISMQPSAGFNPERAHIVFDELERLASECDPSVAAFGESQQGLRSMFLGTVGAGGDCRPSNLLSKPQGGAALASCMLSETEACLPSATVWRCTTRGGAGGACFTDINCIAGFYCPNPALDLGGATCMQRKTDGSACTNANECQSLFCSMSKCVPPGQQVAYCPE